eukprot:5890534-Amphidinium_carterae.1
MQGAKSDPRNSYRFMLLQCAILQSHGGRVVFMGNNATLFKSPKQTIESKLVELASLFQDVQAAVVMTSSESATPVAQ